MVRFVLVIGICFVLCCVCVEAEGKDLSSVKSFAFALGINPSGDNLLKLQQYDLVVVDGEETSKATVETLQANGSIVLGYLSVGTIEKNRSWYKAAKQYRLEFWEDWGEWYVDTSREGFRSLILKRVAPGMLKKGFDGLFLDNTDMVRNHRKQAPGMRSLIASLSKLVHKQHGFLFAQNGEDVITQSLRYLDGWNREDVTSSYNFDTKKYFMLSQKGIEKNQAALMQIHARGILVTATDYTELEIDTSTALSHTNACSAGAISFVSDISLKRLPEQPFECLGQYPS